MQSLYLTGFMGAGKSAVGRLVAEQLAMEFLDTDQCIEAQAGTSIRELFAARGEADFRALERKICLSLPAGKVVALGGGAFMDAAIRRHITTVGISLFLEWPFFVLAKRAAGDPDRPLSQDGEAMLQLYQSRVQNYRRADIIWTSQPPHHYSQTEVAAEVLEMLVNSPLWNMANNSNQV